MLVLKHVEYEIPDKSQLSMLIDHLYKTTSEVNGIDFKEIVFSKEKKEFVLFLECENEDKYHKWREICPPPDGATDWYEIFLSKNEKFK